MLTGKVLITGGSGTLGHAIIATATARRWPCTFTVYSRSEHRQVQLRAQYPHVRTILGDVRDYEKLYAAIVGHETVIHAAAMKHIDLSDQQPGETFSVNCAGSENVIRACMAGQVRQCVAISTDKAARAVTAYGASKLIMEKLFMAAPTDPTHFTVVRYGNVIASNGSVLTVWKDMHRRDGYITATDPDMSRFWLSPEQAVDLIDLALDQAAGTVTIPRLPSISMRILREYFAPDAEFVYNGLRTREKRHEDLLTSEEAGAAVSYAPGLRAPYGYYVVGTEATGHEEEGYRSSAPAHVLTKEEFQALAGVLE